MGMQRPIGAYPTVEMGNKSNAEDIFRTFQGWDVVVVEPFVRQKYIFPFWSILHLIFSYDIELRAYTTKCPIVRGKLMMSMARGIVDFLLYVFLTLRSEARISFVVVLTYSLLLTHFFHCVGCMDNQDEKRKAPLGPNCQTTLSRSTQEVSVEDATLRDLEALCDLEALREVLRTKAGYVHDLSSSMWQVGLSSSVSSIDIAWRLEEVRVEIEEMKARHREYDDVVVRQVEMERAMQEQQQC
ncbi:hypothetical protein CJ030_MR6G018874 [Morella rubra]|uniref:Uncharacterized protein n=1 Tax=Morella rubra TaxID=262757 RepID=A0A6A1VCJ7_9ROSI|nr:hypothetical protein CJ030_MR6G018874 [Morella rubra]